jgi:hypothetical protein
MCERAFYEAKSSYSIKELKFLDECVAKISKPGGRTLGPAFLSV